MNSSKVLIGTWLAAMGIITYRSFHNGNGMPPPRSLFAANVVYSLLGVLGLASQELANVLAGGTLVGLLVTNSTVLGAAAKSVASASGNPAPSAAATQIGTTTTPHSIGGQIQGAP